MLGLHTNGYCIIRAGMWGLLGTDVLSFDSDEKINLGCDEGSIVPHHSVSDQEILTRCSDHDYFC